MKEALSLVAIARFKNERHILYEWVHHHLAEGIDKFILIDDGSDDEFLEYNSWLKPLVDGGVVEIHPSQVNQAENYDLYLDEVRQHTWVIQIDLDEFVFCPDPKTKLKALLASEFDGIDYIQINWKMFQHRSRLQPKSVIDDNVLTHPERSDPSSPMGLKCIARTDFLSSIRIHRCDFTEEVTSVHLRAHNPSIQINHYRTQSDELLYGVKELRGGGVHKDSYQREKLESKRRFTFTMEDSVLKNKRTELIDTCNARPQVRPRTYLDSSWFKGQEQPSE